MKTNSSSYKKLPLGLAKTILLPLMLLMMFLSSAKAQTIPVAIPIEINGGGGAPPYLTDLTQWTGGWKAPQAIYDWGEYQDDPDKWINDNPDAGSTWEQSAPNTGWGILVVDMQELRTINRFSVFQMFSDAKTTGIEIFKNTDYQGSTAPLASGSGWVSVTSGVVAVGAGTTNGSYISNPTAISVADFSSRYIMLHAYNNGDGYIELKGVKAFYYNGSSYSINYMRGGPIPTLTVTTQPVDNIGPTTGTFHGEITDLGQSNPTAHGFCWNTTGTPDIAGTHNDKGGTSTTGTFSSAITGLTPGTTYYVRAYATNTQGTAYGDVKTFTPAVLLALTTQAVTDILSGTATGHGTITDLGASNPTAYGICWGTYNNPDLGYYSSHTDEGGTSSTGAFSSNLTGLTQDQTYYVRAYATNAQGTVYGNEVSFTATATSPPAVTTQAVTDIGYTTATGNGNLTALGVPNATAYGVCWNTAGTPTISDSHTDKGSASATGAFTSSITGLLSATTYYVRAYATNASGTVYGSEVSFPTSNPYNWYALGTGAGNEVFSIAVSGNDVYAGGLFTSMGGTGINGIAKWNGTVWTGLGAGVDDGAVLAIAVNGNDVYIGGIFTNVSGTSIPKIAKWNGSSWSSITTTAPPDGNVSSLLIFNNELYAAGSFVNIDGILVNGIAKWNGTTWSAMGTGASGGSVQTLATDGSNLYAGGAFLAINGIPANGIAKWDGNQWSALGTGIVGAVSAIAIMNGNVYAGGSFINASGVDNTRNLAKWDGTNWSSIGVLDLGTRISALAASNGALYAGGYFDAISGVSANNIAKWNGNSWSRIGTVASNGVNLTVNSLAVQSSSSSMIVGGSFPQTNAISNGTYISRFTDNFNSFPAELVWTGTTSTNWNISTNWSTGSVPTASDNVIIPNVTNDPVVTQSGSSLAVCNNITIASGAVVTIATGKSLTVNGTLTNSAGVTGLVVNSGGSLIESTAGVSATVKSDIPANEWHLISVPVTNATSNVFLGRYLQTHSESTNAYTDITPTNNTLTPMKGFALYGEGGFTSTYTGPLNTATQSYSTAYSGVSNGWNLVGNPYPSSIDWSAASGWTKTNVNNAIYIHVNAATWATFNGSGTNGGTRYIAPGQGFFVQASAAGTLAMTNAVKVHNATTFFKNAEATVPNLLRLQVSGNGYSDEAVVHFAPEATAEFDGSYDAHKLYGDVPEAAQVYTLGSIPLAINSLPTTSTVPMGIYTGAAGTYTLAATEINDLTGVTLEDTHTGIFTDLTKSPCSVELAAGESGQRFILHFGLLSIEEKESSPASIYSYRHTAYIHMNENTSGDIFIYSISGQLVATIPSASGIKEVQLPVSGTYIVKVVAEKATEVRKIFIN